MGVFLVSNEEEVPQALTSYLRVNSRLHEMVVIVSTMVYDVPKVDPSHQLSARHLGKDIYIIIIRFATVLSNKQPHH